LASGSYGTVKLWDVRAEKLLETLEGHVVEGYRVNLIGVPGQLPARTAGHLPQANGGVPTARGEEAAVGAKGGRALS